MGKTECNGAKSCPDEKYVDGWERPPAQSLQTYNGQSKSGADVAYQVTRKREKLSAVFRVTGWRWLMKRRVWEDGPQPSF